MEHLIPYALMAVSALCFLLMLYRINWDEIAKSIKLIGNEHLSDDLVKANENEKEKIIEATNYLSSVDVKYALDILSLAIENTEKMLDRFDDLYKRLQLISDAAEKHARLIRSKSVIDMVKQQGSGSEVNDV